MYFKKHTIGISIVLGLLLTASPLYADTINEIDLQDRLYKFADLIGCAVFAFSGALVAYRKQMDGIGFLVLATVTAIGGGTLRDLLLDVPVFWLSNVSYIYVIIISSVTAIVWLNTQRKIPEKMLEFLDALGLALFTIMGLTKALSLGLPNEIAIVMGLLTGCFGGVIRDVLANEIPLLFQKELYAVCSIMGGICYLVTFYLFESNTLSYVTAFLVILIFRVLAIKYKLGVPVHRHN
ncbi:MAG: trimeric intracellular cation channel family protein [Gammaproteobacteria bacterium]|nr:trimeric intracellular cation channel family protein [Gammaproteobacteria bacterium]NNJ73336.1 trimeric intracellular cation channel family protein [Enterobacterales bacterium]